MRRLQQDLIRKDLDKKMVFLTGPRQVGKTWLALEIAKGFERSVYLNYDSWEDRRIIERRAWLLDTDLLVLDELHKMDGWSNYLKGLFDTKPPSLRILVTGSASLEVAQRSGDSLAGRFFRHRLNPLSIVEIPDAQTDTVDRLLERGGFPEPYLAEDEQEAARWRMQYVDGVLRTDVFEFERVHRLRELQLIFEMLRHRVGSPVSFASLARDVACAPNTVKRYVQVLEALYVVFRVLPHHRNIARAVLKEPKVYFFDVGLVKGDDGARFENLMAVGLLKHVNAVEDYEGKRATLNYVRTKEKKEVDFAVVVEGRPVTLVEAKLSETPITTALAYFHQKYGFPAVQAVKNLRQEYREGEIEVRRAYDFLKTLRL